MKIFKIIVKWSLCILFILIGITNFVGESIDSILMIEDLFLSDILKLTNVGFVLGGLIISPIFDILCKKLNRRYSWLRKFILLFGIIMISIICSLVFASIYRDSVLGYIWSLFLTLLFILLYFYIVYLTNKHKFDEIVKNKWYKVIVVVLILLSIPYFMIKMLIINSYNNMMQHFDIEFLDAIKIESVDLNENDYYVFENLKVKNIFKNYEIVNEQEEPYKSITFVDKSNSKLKGVFLSNYDMFRDNYDEVVKLTEKNIFYKFHPYAKFILSNNISSEQNFYKYLSKNQELSIFDNIGKIYTSWIFVNVSLSSTKSFGMIEHSSYNMSLMTGYSSEKNSVKMIEIINDEDIYTITLFLTNEYTMEDLYSFISSIKLS